MNSLAALSPWLLFAMFAPLVTQSLSAYLWMAARRRREGGRVQAGVLGTPDLLVCSVLVLMVVYITVFGFLNPPSSKDAQLLTPMRLLSGEILQLVFSCAVAGFLVFRRISTTELMGWKRLPLWKVALWGAGLMVLAIPAVGAISYGISGLLPKETSEQVLVSLFRDHVKNGHYWEVGGFFLAAAVLAPVNEELIFRGYLYPVGKRYFGAMPSAVLTSVLFALMHTNLASFAGLFILALCLTLAFEQTGSLPVCMTMHSINNFFTLSLLFFDPGGGLAP